MTRDAPSDAGDGGAEADRWRHLVEHVQDAIVEFTIVDGEPRVRSVNRAFVEVFGYDRESIRGEPLNAHIVPEWLADEARELDARTAAGEVNRRRVKRETAEGLREFRYRGIPYDTTGDRVDGFAVYTDLTERNSYERQFDVLNRLLRHNLRNRTNVILGETERLLATLDGEAGPAHDAAEDIWAAAAGLRTLTRESARIRNELRSTVPHDATVDVVPMLRSLAEEYRRTTAATVELDCPDSLSVRATEQLRSTLDGLVDNAVRHNPAETPRVGLGVTAADAPGWVELHVDDDGPRIPETERTAIESAGDRTQVEHATGLGLWLATLSAESFGGELIFGTSEWSGNRVALRLRVE